jgi:hypothetical protein
VADVADEPRLIADAIVEAVDVLNERCSDSFPSGHGVGVFRRFPIMPGLLQGLAD